MTTPFCEVASVPSCIIIIESYATLITIFLIATLYTPLLLPCMQMYECPPQYYILSYLKESSWIILTVSHKCNPNVPPLTILPQIPLQKVKVHVERYRD